jgi:transposase
MEMLEANERQLEQLRPQLVAIARHVRGAKTLTDSLYGVGPMTRLALTCWRGDSGRFASAHKAVRFASLDVAVYSSAGNRSRGRLSRQGPPVLRWCLYGAGHTHSRPAASDHGYYAGVKHRIDGRRAARSEARKIVRHACHILTDLGHAVVWV